MTDDNYAEALRRIEEAAQTGATTLDLSILGLTSLPSEIGQLTQLVALDLSDNRLTALPSQIVQLTNLTYIHLGNNRLTILPPQIVQLTNLTDVYLTNNRLTLLPPQISQLINLTSLFLRNNQISTLPPEIGQLTNLTTLILSDNYLITLPSEIGQLTNLTHFRLEGNKLTQLPPEFVRLKKPYDFMNFDTEYLLFPPPEIARAGRQAILEFLRKSLDGHERRWVSKLLVVGEGGVGKTSLLRRLRNESFVVGEDSTHGIDIRPLELPHPHEPEIMSLNAWDFGGQVIYHATHQFFLSNRSLFLLVWNARLGYEQGRLYYWLDVMKARAPGAPILLVATHIDERSADLPLLDIQQQYPQVIGQVEISNLTNAGIDQLWEKICYLAAELPLMGETYPTTWLRAAEAIRQKTDRYIARTQLYRLMQEYGVSDYGCGVLARWLHELGDILYYPDDPELEELVILKPQWVSQHISKVLTSPEVTESFGVFRREHMNILWNDLAPEMREHFLRLMEKFDLSYRIPEDDENRSLIVERLSYNEPEYQANWESRVDQSQVSMVYRFDSALLPGIPTWSIARSHRFSTNTHWRYGALFADKEHIHYGLLKAAPNARSVELTVRGPAPHYFFSLLRDAFEVTLERFPGIPLTRLIPCPGHNGESCDGEFEYEYLLGAQAKKRAEVECRKTYEPVPLAQLLLGLHPKTDTEHIKTQLKEMREENSVRHQQTIALLQRQFAYQFNRDQHFPEMQTPYVFTLVPHQRERWNILKEAVSQNLELQLWCQAPGDWHMTESSGRYPLTIPNEQLVALAGHIKKLTGVFKLMLPLAGILGASQIATYAQDFHHHVELTDMLLGALDEIGIDGDAWMQERADKHAAEGATLRMLRTMLKEKDEHEHWGGLKPVMTPEGDVLWLCEKHAAEYRPKIN